MLISADQSQCVSQPVSQITLSQFRISQITRTPELSVTSALRTEIMHIKRTDLHVLTMHAQVIEAVVCSIAPWPWVMAGMTIVTIPGWARCLNVGYAKTRLTGGLSRAPYVRVWHGTPGASPRKNWIWKEPMACLLVLSLMTSRGYDFILVTSQYSKLSHSETRTQITICEKPVSTHYPRTLCWKICSFGLELCEKKHSKA